MPQPAGGWISDRNQTLGQKCISNDRRAATRTGRCAVPAWVTLPGRSFPEPDVQKSTYLRKLKRKFWRSTPNLIQTPLSGGTARPGTLSTGVGAARGWWLNARDPTLCPLRGCPRDAPSAGAPRFHRQPSANAMAQSLRAILASIPTNAP